MAQKIFDTNLRIGGPAGPLIISGTGAPEGVVTAPVGSQYHREDGGTGTTIYRKESGAGDTGWVATAAGGGGGGSPGGAVNQVQFNNGAGGFAGAANILIEGNESRFPAIPTPAAPAADGIKLYNKRKVGQRDGLAMRFANGRETMLAEDQDRYLKLRFRPGPNAATLVGDGSLPMTITGTATAATVQVGNVYQMLPRMESRVSTAAVNAIAGFRSAAAAVRVGRDATAPGGFNYACMWGPSGFSMPTTHRALCGLLLTTAVPNDVDPSTMVNGIWMGWNDDDTNVQVMHAGSGAATKIDLGASFPVPTGTDFNVIYLLELYSPNDLTQSVEYCVTKFNSANLTVLAEASGVITTNLPTVATLLAHRVWCSVGGTSSAVGVSIFGVDIDLDY